jgi:tRNA-2-methylthio-N6-dimethylallyladenosine synthase
VFVAPEAAAERFERLRVIVERSALAKHEARAGRIEAVLIEGPSKKDATVSTGRTMQNKLVHVRTDQTLRPGTFVDARITHAAPHHLTGELVAVTAPPRHKTRIPVASG